MSVETDSLRLFMHHSGVPHRVTSTYRPGTHSYHGREGTGGKGLAADFAAPVPGWDTPNLKAIYEALEPLGPSCAELIYSGPGGGYWRSGARVGPYAEAGHHDHVHIAMPKGWSWQEEPTMPDDPTLHNITGPVELHLVVSGGVCTGYYVFSSTTGEVHAFGPGAPFYGRSEVLTDLR